MKTLLLAENWPPRVGGIENYLTNIAAHLDAEVDVIAPADASLTSGVSSSTPGVFSASVIRKRFFWPVIRPAWLPLFVWLYWRVRREKYGVTLCGKALFEGLIGYYLKKYLGVPYIVFTYAMEVEAWGRRPRERRKLTRVLRQADRGVYINDETRNRLLALNVTENQLVKIWPGVGEIFLKGVGKDQLKLVLKRYQLERPYVLTVARLIERKGIDVLIEAFSQLDQTKFGDVQLVIVGEGPELKTLRQIARQEFIESSVQFIGKVPDEDLPALYTGAEVFVMTSRRVNGDLEGFGIVYLEAAACGTPAIATSSGGAAEAVVDEETGLVVQPDSPVWVKRALERFLSDNELRKRLAEQARERARCEFAWDRRIRLVQKMVDRVVRERRG